MLHRTILTGCNANFMRCYAVCFFIDFLSFFFVLYATAERARTKTAKPQI